MLSHQHDKIFAGRDPLFVIDSLAAVWIEINDQVMKQSLVLLG